MESDASFEDLFDRKMETLQKQAYSKSEDFSDDESKDGVRNSFANNGDHERSTWKNKYQKENMEKSESSLLSPGTDKVRGQRKKTLHNNGHLTPQDELNNLWNLNDISMDKLEENGQISPSSDECYKYAEKHTRDTYVDVTGETVVEFNDKRTTFGRKRALCCPCCRRRQSSLQDESLKKQNRKALRERQRQNCIKCCKKFLTFLFSHIGLCCLVVAYTVFGGFIFMTLEAPSEIQQRHVVETRRRMHVETLWNITLIHNVFSESNWSDDADAILRTFQADIYRATKDLGWDGKDGVEDVQWSFAGSLLYSMTVITTIGYGHIAPKTDGGRFVTIVYALFGIPLTFLCIANLGSLLEKCFRTFYKHLCLLVIKLCCPSQAKWSDLRRTKSLPEQDSLPLTAIKSSETTEFDESPKRKQKGRKEEVRVPVLVSLMLIGLYILGGALLFSEWEKDWALLDGAYFCFITLTTIGFGDLVPGTGEVSQKEKLVICSFYLFFGLAIIAMCFNLMQDEVKKKFYWLGKKIGIIE